MPTITTVDATWDTSVTMDAAELRRADTAMFLGDGTANGVRGGIVRHGDTSLAVAVNGSDQVTVQPGAFVIPAATGLGAYRGALSAATSAVGIAARNGTNPRIDLVVIQAPGIVKTIDGTPGASPVAPALPAQHIELARITVPAVGGGAVTVDSTWRAYAAALGGTLYVETSARLPGSGNHKWQVAIALDTGREYVWSGTAWGSVYGAPALATVGFTVNNQWSRFARIGPSTIHAQGSHNIFQTTGIFEVLLPVAARVEAQGNYPIGHWWALDVGTNYRMGVCAIQGTDRMRFYYDAGGVPVGQTAPFTWVSGDTLGWNVTYEAA